MCRLQHPAHTLVLLPLPALDEVKGLGYADAAWLDELGPRFATRWTQVVPRRELLGVLKGEFGGVVARLVPRLVGECMDQVPVALRVDHGGGVDDWWVSVPLQEFGLRVMARFVGLIAAGGELAGDERWVALS